MKRSYHQFCGIARALDLVGERWTLLIARDLLLGPRRYAELLEGLPGITTNLLAQRLKEMHANGLIEKVEQGRGVKGYRLTELGSRLEPVLMALGRFGFERMTSPGADDVTNIGWALISTKRRYNGRAEVCLELALDGRTFQVKAREGYVDVREGTPFEAEARVAGSSAGMRKLIYAGASAKSLEAAGELMVSGSRDAWRRYLRAFSLVA